MPIFEEKKLSVQCGACKKFLSASVVFWEEGDDGEGHITKYFSTEQQLEKDLKEHEWQTFEDEYYHLDCHDGLKCSNCGSDLWCHDNEDGDCCRWEDEEPPCGEFILNANG